MKSAFKVREKLKINSLTFDKSKSTGSFTMLGF